MTEEIVTGERIQSIAQIYIGTRELFNRKFNIDKDLCLDIRDIAPPYQNPSIVFVYPDVLGYFANVIRHFKYPFTLITHNSDICIHKEPLSEYILAHPLVVNWFAVNVCYRHRKLHPLPIGIANQQWEHGNLANFTPIFSIPANPVIAGANSVGESFTLPHLKKEGIYMNFNVNTAPFQRGKCRSICESKGVIFKETLPPSDFLVSLSQHKYCICPEGNGVDTHRVWECLYVKTVPIILNTPFSIILRERFNIPVVVLDSWESLEIDNLPEYSTFNFDIDCLRMSWVKAYIS